MKELTVQRTPLERVFIIIIMMRVLLSSLKRITWKKDFAVGTAVSIVHMSTTRLTNPGALNCCGSVQTGTNKFF